MDASRLGRVIACLLPVWIGFSGSLLAQAPDVDLTVNGARIEGDGVVVQGDREFTLDLKDTHRNEIGVRVDPPSCASGESMLTYSMRPASAGERTSTQKIMHRVTQDRKLFAEFDNEISVSFDAVFPDVKELPAPEKKGVIFLQIWQGAPYPPPLSLSIVGGDEKNVEVELSINTPDHVRRREVLASIALPRQECIRFELAARPTLAGEKDGHVALSIASSTVSDTESLFSKSWSVNFGFNPENPQNLFPNRCKKKPTSCCSEDGVCHPNRRFAVLFGLYRPSQDVPAQISIGDVRYSLSR